LALVSLLAAVSVPAAAIDIPDSVRAAVDVAIAKVKPALVRIAVVWTDYSDGREEKWEATGSGTIITGEGHVLTNHHVAGHATRIFCTLATKEIIEAELIGSDPQTDIAVIKLKSDGSRIFPAAEFGDSETAHVGDYVLAMGSPMSLSQSVTLGIVSNTELVMPDRLSRWGAFTLDGEDVGTLVRWLAHDADIYPGNSGGPLVNLRGQIIGVNEIKIGLGGAIPGNLARNVARELIATGKVSRAWLGLSVQPQLRTDPDRRGVLVRGAITGSPADAAGFRAGDRLLRLAGQEVSVRFEEQLPAFNGMVTNLRVGEPVEAVVLRDGKETTLNVTPRRYEEMQPPQHELKQWGMTARNLSFVIAREMKRDSTEGVLVTSVRPGGPTGEAKPPIDARDVIVSVNGTAVKNLAELKSLTDQLTQGQKEPVPALVEFDRKTSRLMTVVKVGIKEPPAPGREVQKAWLAADTQVITREVATQMGNPDLKGFRITQVFPQGNAEAAGLKVGDLIYAVDGEPLEASAPEDYEELETLIRQYKIGSTAELAVLRGEEKIKVPVQLSGSPKQSRELREYENFQFEFVARDLTLLDKVKEKWPVEKTGALVVKVESGGWAAVGGLFVGDLIVRVDSTPITGADDLEKRLDEIESAKAKSVVFLVERGIYSAFLEFEPKWDTALVAGKE
jgi:serine protease Do